MLVSSVLEKCIKTRFFSTQGGNFRNKFLSRQAYQDAAKYIFVKRKDYCFRNYEVLLVLINYNGIIRNDILEANIQFYRVVRVIPQKYYVQIYTMHNKFINCFVWMNSSTSDLKFHLLS